MQNKHISTLHYITPNLAHQDDYLLDIAGVCKSGATWVQLRMKEFPKETILQIASKAKNICDQYGCQLIINDHPEIAHKVRAAGVHVGKEDKKVAYIRERYGSKLIIGATANRLEDIIEVSETADYIGLGPFRFTETKKKLSPILGKEGYVSIMESLRIKGITIPVLGIGGIEEADIDDLSATGIYGVALSGLIHKSENQKLIIEHITKTFDYANYSQ
ncbi:thiamine phosphate synthase [Echinicola marina]|uniref:thiamine phosphate synthase n=1 Tax=Echinicola marina TaxID=2859768 RepID=UPI001CF62728|nr:thiamine phosphate synthase [Echinicola marina]UCS92627.1 thiamine phosphate synthase [Echinicola marina]